MRIRVSHQTDYRYQHPVRGVIQVLRLTPRSHDGQYVVDWRIEVSDDCRLEPFTDAQGNACHTFTVEGPISELTVRVDGEVVTEETHGVVRGATERFPPTFFLRQTPLTAADQAITRWATEIAETEPQELGRLHRLLQRLHQEMAFDSEPTHVATSAAEAFALHRGVCQDYAHIFLAAARELGIAARYVSGYFLLSEGTVDQEAGHAWAEAHVPDLGWVGFDPANGIGVTEAHVRVAVGLDYLDAAPVRGTYRGGAGESLHVAVRVEQAGRQLQS